MTQKSYLKTFLIAALLFLSVGGFMMHYFFHPIMGETAKLVNFVPFIAGLMSIFIVTTLFLIKNLMPYAYLMNGMLAIIGMITMASFTFHGKPYPLLPDILILFSVFCIGKLLFELELTREDNLIKPRHKGRFFRYPNMGYWIVHLVSLSAVFALGHILWM